MERSDWPAISVRLTAGVDAVVQLQYSDVRVKVRGKFHILDGVDGLRVPLLVIGFSEHRYIRLLILSQKTERER